MKKVILPIVSCLILVSCGSSPKIKVGDTAIDKKIFSGIWKLDSERDEFELNSDSATFSLYLNGNQVSMKGHWDIIELNIGNELTPILVLKNEVPTTGTVDYPEDRYYKFYLFSIDKITNGQIYITDLSAGAGFRRNKQVRLTHN
ncbi:MAG: hypothetical protein NTY88_11000 [Bacteroidetes bacterium]|nr:hypothetical protein [Bacteroidota bacterium]